MTEQQANDAIHLWAMYERFGAPDEPDYGDGIVQLGIQTRSLSKERYSSLIEFTRAWCADNGVVTR